MHAMKTVHECLHHLFEWQGFIDHVLKKFEEEKEAST
jgi:hypothetical protein